jgi:hypothetical protein
MTDSKSFEKWREKLELSYGEYMNPPYWIPHEGVVRLARDLEKAVGKKQAHEIIDKTAKDLHTEFWKTHTKNAPIKSLEEFFQKIAIWSPGTDGEAKESTPNKLVFHVTACLYAQTFRELGASDIGYLWECKQDYNLLTLCPGLKLKRTKTLMQGHDCCDFTWAWENE